MKLSEVEVLRMVSVVLDAASVITCTWLLWKVPAANRRFLLPKQIVNLALADALAASMEVALETSMQASSAGFLPWWVYAFLKIVEMLFLWASLLLEVHISVGFLALYWRRPTLVMFLKRTVWLTWATAAFMSLVSGFIFFNWRSPAVHAGIFCFATAPALAIATAMYIAAWFRSLFFPLRGEQRAVRMLSLYTATFLLTYVPMIMCAHLHIHVVFTGPFLPVNGVLNVLLYSCHTRFSGGSVWRDLEEEGGMSVAQWRGRSALSVGFSMSVPLELHVPAVQRTALEVSEREITDIERTRADLPGEQ